MNVLLSMDPEQRLALELEEWIRARGGKTTLAEITSEAPQKLRESKSLPAKLPWKLLGILERNSRGNWTMVIQPMLATNRASLGNCVSTFYLKGVRGAA